MGDNAGAALGLAIGTGDVLISIGTCGTVCRVSREPSADASATVAGFADATGRFLPLVARSTPPRAGRGERMLGVELDELSRLALSAPPGAGGVVLVPYLDGERTPNLPHANGALHGLTLDELDACSTSRAPRSRACSCGLGAGLDALVANGVEARRLLLIGGGSRQRRSDGSRRRSSAVRWSCRRRPSTSPTAPPARPPGRWPALLRSPGRLRRASATRPTPTSVSALATPKRASCSSTGFPFSFATSSFAFAFDFARPHATFGFDLALRRFLLFAQLFDLAGRPRQSRRL